MVEHFPTSQPSNTPTHNPSKLPTSNPSAEPSKNPTTRPSFKPSLTPSKIPTLNPSVSFTFDYETKHGALKAILSFFWAEIVITYYTSTCARKIFEKAGHCPKVSKLFETNHGIF